VLFAFSIIAGILPASVAFNTQDSNNVEIKDSNNKAKINNPVKVNGKYRYSKIGDCWAMSNHIHKKLKKKGVKNRIVQYRTRMSSRHRSVQIYKYGKWTDYGYRRLGYNPIYNATKRKPGLKVVASFK
jgi:hypothetical protein